MNRLSRAWLGVLTLGLLGWTACGPSVPPQYARHRQQARSAIESGRYEEAAQHWLRAADSDGTVADRQEALYRAAHNLLRTDQHARALALLKSVQSQGGSRAARAAVDIAEVNIQDGKVQLGQSQLATAVRTFPNAAIAPTALKRHIHHLQASSGPAAALLYVDAEIEQLAGTGCEEPLRYYRARLLDADGRTADAVAAYQEVAHRYPYPEGVYWDDSLLRGSELLALKQPAVAEAMLRFLISHREESWITGSYDRQYAMAQFRLARLLEGQGSSAGALREYLELLRQYPESRYRDDSLWAAARLQRARNRRAEACKLSRRLIAERPRGRYSKCAHLLCAELPPRPDCGQRTQAELATTAGVPAR